MPLCAGALGRARWEGLGWGWPCRDTSHGVPGDIWAGGQWTRHPGAAAEPSSSPALARGRAGALLCIVCHLHLGGGCDGGVRMSCRRVICVQLSIGGAHHLGRDECQQGQPGGLQPFPSLRGTGATQETTQLCPWGQDGAPTHTAVLGLGAELSPRAPSQQRALSPLEQPWEDPSSWEPRHQDRGMMAASSRVGERQGLAKLTAPRSPSHS